MDEFPSEADFIVVGAGVAGLRAAIALSSTGTVLVLSKRELAESATEYAQGGIAVALSDEDEIVLHYQDTLKAGDGIVDPKAAKILVEEGPERIQELIEWGTQFDRAGTKLAFTREAAHSRSRVLHAHGDSTGREIGRCLQARARTLKNISFCEFEFTADLWLENQQVCGITVIDQRGGLRSLRSSAVLLATGGAGQVYSNTTNPAVATGDGVAMAYRAGAVISDMEFFQFHPTALYLKGAPRFLISEAVRGEGAYLRNSELVRFMPKYHPLAELAPRDVVARAIMHELSISASPDPLVFLDMTHLHTVDLPVRFPRIYSTCLQYKVDITSDLVPVRPAAHYLMGGVQTDLHGRTSLRRLYAAGEVAATGVHGANRLASNSLLEGLVYGARAGAAMNNEVGSRPEYRSGAKHPSGTGEVALDQMTAHELQDPDKVKRSIQELMWKQVGIVRSGDSLRTALSKLAALAPQLPASRNREACEARNIYENALLITKSALAREESRGAHYRTDFPLPDDEYFKKHSVVTGKQIRFR